MEKEKLTGLLEKDVLTIKEKDALEEHYFFEAARREGVDVCMLGGNCEADNLPDDWEDKVKNPGNPQILKGLVMERLKGGFSSLTE